MPFSLVFIKKGYQGMIYVHKTDRWKHYNFKEVWTRKIRLKPKIWHNNNEAQPSHLAAHKDAFFKTNERFALKNGQGLIQTIIFY